MAEILSSLRDEYRNALNAYILTLNEEGLTRAYELGRRALIDGLGILDVAGLRYQALMPLLLQNTGHSEVMEVVQRDAGFLSETLAPFEVAQRAFRAALSQSETRLQHVLASSPVVLYSVRLDGSSFILDWVSENLTRVFGYAPADPVQRNNWWLDRVHPRDRRGMAKRLRGLLRAGEVAQEYRFRHADGSYHWVWDEVRVIEGTMGHSVEAIGSWTDITQRRQSEEERSHLLAEVEDLSRRLLRAQDDERRRIAYDIHDGVTQMVEMGLMYLQTALDRRMGESDEPPSDPVVKAKACLEGAVKECRSLLVSLHPPLLDDLGLTEALRQHLREVAGRTQTRMEFDAAVADLPVDNGVRTALFRIAQEAVSNAVKHSGSQRVRVRLGRTRARFYLEIKDWGRGISKAEPGLVGASRLRLGLAGMRERAALAGATFRLRSRPGRGTTVRVEMPYPAQDGGKGR